MSGDYLFSRCGSESEDSERQLLALPLGPSVQISVECPQERRNVDSLNNGSVVKSDSETESNKNVCCCTCEGEWKDTVTIPEIKLENVESVGLEEVVEGKDAVVVQE